MSLVITDMQKRFPGMMVVGMGVVDNKFQIKLVNSTSDTVRYLEMTVVKDTLVVRTSRSECEKKRHTGTFYLAT